MKTCPYPTYKISNSMVLTKTTPLQWEVKSEYVDGTGELFYSIYIPTSFMDGHICVFINNILSISRMRYSADEPSIKFQVNTIEEAGEIVLKFAKGMGCEEDLKETVYYKF